MQQTTNYKLNLIETSDPFSPGPLNENAEKTETELAALDSRVTMLEAKYIVFGTYTGDGEISQFIELGFTPKAVLVHHVAIQFYTALALIEQPSNSGGGRNSLEIVENGFNAYNGVNSRDLNEKGGKLVYAAFA